MITFKVFENYEELSQHAAQLIKEEMQKHQKPVLGLATGSTPIGLYKELVRLHKEEGLDFSNVTSVNLDEYIGLAGDHDQSYRYFMNDQLFNHVNIDKNNTYIPNGLAGDSAVEGKAYDQKIADLGGVDVQILGIGANGHIAFNEPTDKLIMGTHETDLTQSTIEANSRFFESADDVPKTAITMGLGSIMSARKIILLASGENKAEVIARLQDDTLDTQVPATLLKLHKDVTVLVDKAAARDLK